MSWSWTELLRAHEGDEDRALAALPDQEGLGGYSDEVHWGDDHPMVLTVGVEAGPRAVEEAMGA